MYKIACLLLPQELLLGLFRQGKHFLISCYTNNLYQYGSLSYISYNKKQSLSTGNDGNVVAVQYDWTCVFILLPYRVCCSHWALHTTLVSAIYLASVEKRAIRVVVPEKNPILYSARKVQKTPGDVNTIEEKGECEDDLETAEAKNCRGRTMMKEMPSRKFEHHVAIMLNEYNQPIGPDKAIVNQFSSFLGTLARIPSLCHIDCTDWRLLKTKENMWSYAQKKWIIPGEGKKWVLATINGSLQRYKTMIKQKFYKTYDNDKERHLNRPKCIPEEQFKGFIEMVGSKECTEIMVGFHSSAQDDKLTVIYRKYSKEELVGVVLRSLTTNFVEKLTEE
ncbi:hypothetical protein KSP40_PGU011081 [Platanthera guangdongensis]|uniref:Uncharacterized protein n=1 Tax=Platanthera guangdongensis TaxID=2320717 RepID=A0ABR2MHT6_9ASPA